MGHDVFNVEPIPQLLMALPTCLADIFADIPS